MGRKLCREESEGGLLLTLFTSSNIVSRNDVYISVVGICSWILNIILEGMQEVRLASGLSLFSVA